MYWYWWLWIAFVLFVILMPLGYGWGYRGWGPPYPRYYDRGRARVGGRPYPAPGSTQREPLPGDPGMPVAGASTGAWGVAADIFWLAVLGAIIWAIVAWAY